MYSHSTKSGNDSSSQPMPTLPDDCAAYNRTALFTQDSIPEALLKEHATAEYKWARINIESGSLMYHITEPEHEGEYLLDAHHAGVIAAAQPHFIKPLGDVSFFIEFYRRPGQDGS